LDVYALAKVSYMMPWDENALCIYYISKVRIRVLWLVACNLK